MRGKWILFAGVTILLAVAAGALSLWRQSAAPKVEAPRKPVATPAVNPPEVSLPGKVQAQRVVSVPAPIDGTIEAFSADVGQDVFEGQLIAQIRNTKVDSTLELATAEVDKAQARVTSTEGEITAGRLESSRASADAA